ncbi:hypothetical protein ABPG72_015584 [Tetrahymena utriculariae]
MNQQDLKSNFSQAATMLTKLFNSANHQYKEAYAKGQKDMINEIVQFCLQENNNLKTIELQKLEVFLQEKLNKIQEKQNQQQQILEQIGRQANIQSQQAINSFLHINQQQFEQQNKIQMAQNSNTNQQNGQISYNSFNIQGALNSNNNQNIQLNAQQLQFIPNTQQHQDQIQQNLNALSYENNANLQLEQQSNSFTSQLNQEVINNQHNRRIFQIKGYKMQNNNQNNTMNEEPNQ